MDVVNDDDDKDNGNEIRPASTTSPDKYDTNAFINLPIKKKKEGTKIKPNAPTTEAPFNLFLDTKIEHQPKQKPDDKFDSVVDLKPKFKKGGKTRKHKKKNVNKTQKRKISKKKKTQKKRSHRKK